MSHTDSPKTILNIEWCSTREAPYLYRGECWANYTDGTTSTVFTQWGDSNDQAERKAQDAAAAAGITTAPHRS